MKKMPYMQRRIFLRRMEGDFMMVVLIPYLTIHQEEKQSRTILPNFSTILPDWRGRKEGGWKTES